MSHRPMLRPVPLRRRLVLPAGLGLAALLSLGGVSLAQAPAAGKSAPAPAPAGAANTGASTAANAPPAAYQTAVSEGWNAPFAPFHLIGNIHYVGAGGVSSFLITTKAGNILLDGGLPETAPLIRKSIAELGFQLSDVKVLLNSHAHFDHAGGLAELKQATHAQLVASAGDAPRLRSGSPKQPAVVVDRVVKDGDTVELGGTVLRAHVTPGHTPGCTTWTMTTEDAGRKLNVVFYCSTSVVDRLVDNAAYPTIVADYQRSFPVLRELPCDVFLGPHPEFFQMATKRQAMSAGKPNPFIDPGELRRYVDQSEKQFLAALQKEQH